MTQTRTTVRQSVALFLTFVVSALVMVDISITAGGPTTAFVIVCAIELAAILVILRHRWFRQ